MYKRLRTTGLEALLLFPNVMKHSVNPSSPACATLFAKLCNSITCQQLELESCSNPLRIQQVF